MKISYQNLSNLKLVNIFIKLVNYISNSKSESYNDNLLIWRQKIFTSFMLSAIVLGAFTYIQNMKIALQSGNWPNSIIYTAIYSLAIIITLARIIPFKFRACVGLFLLYAMGLMSLLTAGPVGSGRIWLFSFAVLTCLLLGLKAGFVALILNVGTFSFFTLCMNAGYIDIFQLSDYTTEYWVANYLSFLFANTVITVSLGVFVAGLEKNLKNEQLLTSKLKSSNIQLEKENEERKLAEESLRKSEERFRIVSEITSDFSYSFGVDDDKNLVLDWTTEAVVRITGYESTELSSTDGWRKIIHPADKIIKKNHVKTLLSGQSATVEYRILSKTGEVCWLLDHGYPLIDSSSNSVRKIYGAVQDITQRRQAVAALQESEEKYRLLIENADNAIFIAQDEIMKFPNPKTLELLGCSEDYLLKTPFLEFIHPEDRNTVITSHRSRLKGGNPPSAYSFRVINKQGDKIWTQLNTTLITWEGRPATLNFLRDITKEKGLELQLQQAQKMEAIGTLAGGVAHDLNNILSGMVSYPELLLLDLPEDSSLREPIETIQASGQKAAAIVQDLLTLARRGVSISEVVCLNQVISQYLNSPEHKRILSYHPQVEVNTSLGNDLCNIIGSPVHLSKTIMNLVSNSAEAMPDGGSIFISTDFRYINKPIVGFETIDEGEYVILTISDRGTGISSTEVDKIFEPFYTKKVMGRSGTGLGMAVVWGTVKDHKGFIDVRSSLGKGTTFTIYFPKTRKELESHKDAIKIEDYMGSGESILVVDDVPSQREIATSMLKKIGYNVESVASGEEAIDYLKGKPIDLLLLDMIMEPGINGLET
ncbi:MAG: PAS domain S-box protein, partial [Desulfobacteraceae bacterium]|nr:PAS domain S-box protein [Desulfobacteraceae bacterium]